MIESIESQNGTQILITVLYPDYLDNFSEDFSVDHNSINQPTKLKNTLLFHL